MQIQRCSESEPIPTEGSGRSNPHGTTMLHTDAQSSGFDMAAPERPAQKILRRMSDQRQPTVSILIKALNEEQHIAAAIESALEAIRNIEGEVILADGGSSDRTIDIARQYPITIVQLNRMEDRSCGSGAQLGFQYSCGEFLMLIDGDMQLESNFIAVAIQTLRTSSSVAGVGGAIRDSGILNEEYEQRNKRHDPDRRIGRVTRLNCAGLYRRTAIESIGYLTDRNLHGGEELDLGARLRAAGWMLARIEHSMVEHHPHTGSAYGLLVRRFLNKNAWGPGEALRGAMWHPHFWLVSKERQYLTILLAMCWWLTFGFTILALSGWLVFAAGLILLAPFAGMALRWRSVRLALYSVMSWNVCLLGFWPGYLRRRKPPASWIESTVLQEPWNCSAASRARHGNSAQ